MANTIQPLPRKVQNWIRGASSSEKVHLEVVVAILGVMTDDHCSWHLPGLHQKPPVLGIGTMKEGHELAEIDHIN